MFQICKWPMRAADSCGVAVQAMHIQRPGGQIVVWLLSCRSQALDHNLKRILWCGSAGDAWGGLVCWVLGHRQPCTPFHGQ